MKIVKLLVISAFVLGICKPVGAISFDVKNVKSFANLDVFTAGTAGDRFDSQLKASKASGAMGSYKLNTDPAIGLRIGALYPVQDIVDAGISIGYIAGPNGDTKVNGAKFYKEINRRFFRFLAEGQKTFKFNDKVSFLGGAGMGIAFGRQEFVLQTPNVINGVSIDTADKYFKGFTWELSAGAIYKATDKMDVELGVRYAGFPSCPNTNDINGNGEIPGMNWNSLGFFTGVRF